MENFIYLCYVLILDSLPMCYLSIKLCFCEKLFLNIIYYPGFEKAGWWCVKVFKWQSHQGSDHSPCLFQRLAEDSYKRCWPHCRVGCSPYHKRAYRSVVSIWFWKKEQWDNSCFWPWRRHLWCFRYIFWILRSMFILFARKIDTQ